MSEPEVEPIITSPREHLDRHPLLIAEMLASDDESLRKSAIPMLVAFLRGHGSPMLAEMAKWLDPKANSRWCMKISPRRPGAPISSFRRPFRDAELLDEYEQLTASGLGQSEAVIADLAKRFGRTAKAIGSVLTRARRRRDKMAPSRDRASRET